MGEAELSTRLAMRVCIVGKTKCYSEKGAGCEVGQEATLEGIGSAGGALPLHNL